MGNKMMTECVACDCIFNEDDAFKDPRSMSPMLRRIQEQQHSYTSIHISKELKKDPNIDHGILSSPNKHF